MKNACVGSRNDRNGTCGDAAMTSGFVSSSSIAESHVGAAHEHLGVREVDHEQDAVDERVAQAR